MMQLEENKSKIWFKVLNPDGGPIDGTLETWSLPQAGRKGGPTTFLPFADPRKYYRDNQWLSDPSFYGVTWLVSNPRRFYQLNSGMKIYVAQIFSTPVYEEEGMIWADKVTLLREATNLDLKPFGIFRAFEQAT